MDLMLNPFHIFQPRNYSVCGRVFNKVTGHLLKLPEDSLFATERMECPDDPVLILIGTKPGDGDP